MNLCPCGHLGKPAHCRYTPDRGARPDKSGRKLLQQAVEHLSLSARAYMRIRRLARTLADVEGRDAVVGGDYAEAIQPRKLEQGAGAMLARAE